MGRLRLLVVLLALPVASASGGTGKPALLYATGSGVLVAAADGSGRLSLSGTGLGNPHEIVWSPDGTKAAFTTLGQDGWALWAVDADGSNLRRLATTASDDLLSPAFSPDSAQLAYLSERSSNSPVNVWVIDSTGGEAKQLTTSGVTRAKIAWSPDGRRLLVTAAGSPSTVSAIDLATDAITTIADGVVGVWSPDGRKIALVDPEFHLLVMNADGSGARQVAQRTDSRPVWSADGTTILFDQATPIGPATKFGLPTRSDVYSVSADGRFPARRLTGPLSPVPLVYGADGGRAPVISGDGSQIYYQQPQAAGDSAVWRMNPDGTCRQPVAALGRVVLGPLWRSGASFGPSERCVDLRVYAVPQAEYFPIVGRAGAIVMVENDGNEPASGLRFAADASGAGARGVRCVPGCAMADLQPGATGALLVDAATSAAGALSITIHVASDQPSVDPVGSTTVTTLTVLPCSIVGTDGPDHLVGTRRADRICGKPGADWISGGAGDDYLDAGSGNDTVIGGPGRDTILGRGGRDTIFARDGHVDWIDCGTEYDVAVVDRIDHVRGCERVLRR